jgi:hypothetical protein
MYTYIKLDAVVHAKSHRVSVLYSIFMLFIYCLLHRTGSHFIMTGGTGQASPITSDATASGPQAVTGTESNIASVSSSSNAAMQSIAKKKVPMLYEYWKAPTVIAADLAAYHAAGWLPGGVLSSTIDLEFLDMCFS